MLSSTRFRRVLAFHATPGTLAKVVRTGKRNEAEHGSLARLVRAMGRGSATGNLSFSTE